jgi:hypothetical protein
VTRWRTRAPSQISAAIRAVFGGTVASALIIVFVLRLVSALVSKTFSGKRAIWVIVLAFAIPLGAFAYQAQRGWRAMSGKFDDGQTNASTGPTGYGAENFAGFNNWKRGVEQALKDAKAREEARQQDAAKAQESVDGAKASEGGVQAARENKTRADENNATVAANPVDVASAPREAIAANGAKRATETKGPFSDGALTADAQEQQPGSTGRFDVQSRWMEIQRPTGDTDAEVAQREAMARHALTYSWVTTDRTGRRWVHIRPLRYRRHE